MNGSKYPIDMARPHHLFRCPLQLTTLLLCAVSLAAQVEKNLAPSFQSLNAGRIDEAISLARAANPQNAFSHNILCRAYYAETLSDSAIPECEAAVSVEPGNSEYTLWLGRAYGMKAEQGGPVTGLTMARRVHAMFERAVQLDGNNISAMSDLGQFYVDAPAIIGGGYAKAEKLAARMQPINAAGSHRLLAQVADKRKDYATAEKEFSTAIAAEHSPAHLIDLAQFYQRRNRIDEAVAQLKQAVDLDRNSDASIVDVASILAEMHREPQLSIELYRRYLDSPNKSEAASAPQVHLRLGRLLQQSGDPAAARREYQAALALASGYRQAHAALEKLPAQ